jgi:hypothetical protein
MYTEDSIPTDYGHKEIRRIIEQRMVLQTRSSKPITSYSTSAIRIVHSTRMEEVFAKWGESLCEVCNVNRTGRGKWFAARELKESDEQDATMTADKTNWSVWQLLTQYLFNRRLRTTKVI